MKKVLLILSVITCGIMMSCNPTCDCNEGCNGNCCGCEQNNDNPVTPPGGDDGYNGYAYVDLGLPSGLKWATCNVGASSPEDYGDYFAWGETSPKTEYTEENSLTNGKKINTFTANAQYDAATANWGGSWRMPTRDEMDELVKHCEREWTQVNHVYGSKYIGPNGNSIFLPAAGYRDGLSLEELGYNGFYWTSSPVDFIGLHVAASLYFFFGNQIVQFYDRYLGRSVRPVSE